MDRRCRAGTVAQGRVLEPDGLRRCPTASTPETTGADRDDHFAVDTLTALPGAAVYIDAGHSAWMPAAEIAPLLVAAGVAKADGFSLNVSNYQWTADLLKYGHDISARVGGKHFIIDTGRNGNGPPTGFDKKDERNWCNPDGRALGVPPTTNTGDPLCDAFFWLKPPANRTDLQQGWPRGRLAAAEGAGDGAQREW
jgi:endoglucanase